MRKLTCIAATVALAAVAATSSPAGAAYPGSDGRIAFGMMDGAGPDIYSALPNGHGLKRLTTDPGFDACAAYSPDGNRLAFCSDRSGAFEVWTMRANGKDQQRVTHIDG